MIIWWSYFIPSRNLEIVFTYNHMVLIYMSLRSRSHVRAYIVLTKYDHIFIHNYISSLLNIIVISPVFARKWLQSVYGYIVLASIYF